MKQTAKIVAAAACAAACMLLTACGGQNSSDSQAAGTETTAASEATKTTQAGKSSSAVSDTKTTSGSASSSDKKSESAASSNKQSTTAGSSNKQSASAAVSDKQSASAAASDKKSASAASSAKQDSTQPAPSVSYTEKTAWKKLYLDWLDRAEQKDRKGFQLIQVDEDGIPELYVSGDSQKTPPLLLWVKNGKLYQTELSPAGFQYIRMKNLFMNVTTVDGKTTDVIQKLNGDKAETVASGEYSAKKDNTFYRWNGAAVSAADYTAARDKLFNKNDARNVHKLKKLEDIRTALEQYKMYQ